jgi:hypothetical protein
MLVSLNLAQLGASLFFYGKHSRPPERLSEQTHLPRQGYHLLSMLFLIIMEVLHVLIRRSDDWGMCQQVGSRELPHRASLYADDLVMFICPTIKDLLNSRCIFSAFEGASGLDCNLAKMSAGVQFVATMNNWLQQQMHPPVT